MNDETSRPAIVGDFSELESFNTIFVGYPIWDGTAPHIINTFFESCNLKGKTIYTFCTSGGSGIETSVGELQASYPDLHIVSGQRFRRSDSEDTIQEWLQGLGGI